MFYYNHPQQFIRAVAVSQIDTEKGEHRLKARILTGTLLLLTSLLILVSIAYAAWSTLGMGYAITSNYHGVQVPSGVPVTVTAGTLDPAVTQITFRWHMPNGTTRWDVTVPVYTNGTTGQWNNGTTALIRYAQNTQTPDVTGDWGVQAFFRDSTGTDKADLTNVIAIKATSFNTIPEIPIIGTAGAAVAMLLGLGFFMTKRRKPN
jgi:hypothetical protein